MPDKKRKILIVEDDDFMIRILTRELKQAGFDDFRVVSIGEEVLKEFEKYRPDIIILDILLPGKSGLEALEEIRKIEDGKRVPVFILTNYSSSEYRETALKLGVKEYLIKSNMLISDLVEKIKSLP